MTNNTDKFFHLLEYTIGKGKQLLVEADTLEIPDVQEQPLGYEKKGKLGSAPKPGVPATEDTMPDPVVPSDESIPSSISESEKENDAEVNAIDSRMEMAKEVKDDVEDVLAKLVRLHSDKLASIESYMEQNDMIVQQVQTKANEFDMIQGEISHMKDQIHILTPPTPLESGNKMIAISGGTRIEDYWNNWLAKNKRDERVEDNPYYPGEGQEESYSIKLDDVPDLSKDQIKKSFFGKGEF